MLIPRTSVLICVLMDIHGRPVCANEHTWTATDVLCVLPDVGVKNGYDGITIRKSSEIVFPKGLKKGCNFSSK